MLPDRIFSCIVFLFGTAKVVLGDATEQPGGPQGKQYKRNPAPDGHRCGICPTYYQKICAFDFTTDLTYIFDNHCVMDLYNCLHGTEFEMTKYEACLFFGNFEYVHGAKYEDNDYDEDHIHVIDTPKNPPFA